MKLIINRPHTFVIQGEEKSQDIFKTFHYEHAYKLPKCTFFDLAFVG